MWELWDMIMREICGTFSLRSSNVIIRSWPDNNNNNIHYGLLLLFLLTPTEIIAQWYENGLHFFVRFSNLSALSVNYLTICRSCHFILYRYVFFARANEYIPISIECRNQNHYHNNNRVFSVYEWKRTQKQNKNKWKALSVYFVFELNNNIEWSVGNDERILGI